MFWNSTAGPRIPHSAAGDEKGRYAIAAGWLSQMRARLECNALALLKPSVRPAPVGLHEGLWPNCRVPEAVNIFSPAISSEGQGRHKRKKLARSAPLFLKKKAPKNFFSFAFIDWRVASVNIAGTATETNSKSGARSAAGSCRVQHRLASAPGTEGRGRALTCRHSGGEARQHLAALNLHGEARGAARSSAAAEW